MSSVEISALRKRYGQAVALDEVSLTAGQGELVTLLGPSGCGKTTALRCIAGFIAPDGGDIRADGVSILSTPSSKRDFGVVFQNYALFPHLNVSENVGYGLLFRNFSKDERERRVREVLDQVQLGGLEHRLERELRSGHFRVRAGAAALDVKGAGPFTPNARAVLLARPESLAIVTDGSGQLEGRVTKSVFLGAVQHCEVALPDGTCVRLGVPPDRALPPDGPVAVRLDVERTWLMPDVAP